MKGRNKPILSVALKNALKKELGDGMEYSFKNIIINGVKWGCSGFVRNPDNQVTVYINTELRTQASYMPSTASEYGHLVRYAANMKDFRGCRNRTDSHSLTDIVDSVSKMLADKEQWERECRAFGKAGVV